MHPWQFWIDFAGVDLEAGATASIELLLRVVAAVCNLILFTLQHQSDTIFLVYWQQILLAL